MVQRHCPALRLLQTVSQLSSLLSPRFSPPLSPRLFPRVHGTALFPSDDSVPSKVEDTVTEPKIQLHEHRRGPFTACDDDQGRGKQSSALGCASSYAGAHPQRSLADDGLNERLGSWFRLRIRLQSGQSHAWRDRPDPAASAGPR